MRLNHDIEQKGYSGLAEADAAAGEAAPEDAGHRRVIRLEEEPGSAVGSAPEGERLIRLDDDGGRAVSLDQEPEVVVSLDDGPAPVIRLEPAPIAQPLPTRRVVGLRVQATSYDDASDRIVEWARAGEARIVTVNSVNNVMTAHDDPAFALLSNEADLATPDGMPLVWALRRLGVPSATRVCGSILMPRVLDKAEAGGVPVGFYGGTPEVLAMLEGVVAERWPRLQVAYRYSPPFRALSEVEDRRVTDDIRDSGARILFVGIGCPKQEVWMSRHRERLPVVQVGVGAAFDFLTGYKRQAPVFVQNAGLEWLFRLVSEPRRLWSRYMRQNPRFMWLLARQIMQHRRTEAGLSPESERSGA